MAFHPACHLDTHEERAYGRLHGLFGIPVGPANQPLTVESLGEVREPVAALVVELPQRDLGGTLPTWEELAAQVAWARERGAAVHLDGARLWEASPFYGETYGKSIRDIAGLFDTVYVSFYKGLGGISGCCVAGATDVVEELSVFRTRHGGRCFILWPYAASALSALQLRLPRMPRYYAYALAIADALRDVPGVELLPDPAQSPMMHIRLATGTDELRARVVEIATKEKLWMCLPMAEGPTLQRFEFSLGDATLEMNPPEIRALVERLLGASATAVRPRRRQPAGAR